MKEILINATITPGGAGGAFILSQGESNIYLKTFIPYHRREWQYLSTIAPEGGESFILSQGGTKMYGNIYV